MNAPVVEQTPFQLLQSLDQKSREESGDSVDGTHSDQDWTGLLCRIGDDQVLVPMSMLSEIVPPPEFTSVPGVKSWIPGLVNLHGTLISVVDLQGFLHGRNIPVSDQAQRLLVVVVGVNRIGLLVNEVFGIKHFQVGDEVREAPAFDVVLQPYITAALKRFNDHYAVFNLERLLNAPELLDAKL